MTSKRIPPLTVVGSAQFPAAQLPRVSCSSRADVAGLIDAGRPVVITPAEELGAGRLQAPDDLRHVFNGLSVTVSAAQDRSSRLQTGATNMSRRMTFADFASYVENPHERGAESLYLSQFPLDTVPVELGSELMEPSFMPEGCSVVSTNLWYGPGGTVSPLHFDQNHNLLHQHHGHKHVILADPCQFHLLKPEGKNSAREHVSSLELVTGSCTIDLSALSFSCFETVLGPGDVLFVPAFWWHHVMSLEVAISVNYWWRAPISACLYPGLFRFLSSRFVYRDPSVVARAFDLEHYKLDTGLCLFLADRGHAFAAAALTGAIVTAFCYRALKDIGLAAESPDSASSTGEYPDFAQARTVVRALAAQGLISASQQDLLRNWLDLAHETAAEPDLPAYSSERARIIRSMISQLHAECGKWLSI